MPLETRDCTHANAAGFAIPADSYNELLNLSNIQLASYDFGDNVYSVDFIREATDDDIAEIIFDLAQYEEVWGQDNPQSLIAVTNLKVTSNDIKVIGKNGDTIRIEKNGITYIKFRAKDIIKQLSDNEQMTLTIIGKPNVNEWMGSKTPQIQIVELNISKDREPDWWTF